MTQKTGPKSLIEWLGMTKVPEYANAPWFIGLLGFIAAMLGILLFVAAVGLVFDFARASFGLAAYAENTDASAVRNIGLTLAALFGAPFLVWRTVVAANR